MPNKAEREKHEAEVKSAEEDGKGGFFANGRLGGGSILHFANFYM